MQPRSIAAVILLSLFTFGIYAIVWFVKTKNEMNRQGADIPTALLMIIPLVGIYWQWKWCEGVERVTSGKVSQIVSFLLLCCLGVIGMAIVQDAFNKTAQAQTVPRAYAVG